VGLAGLPPVIGSFVGERIGVVVMAASSANSKSRPKNRNTLLLSTSSSGRGSLVPQPSTSSRSGTSGAAWRQRLRGGLGARPGAGLLPRPAPRPALAAAWQAHRLQRRAGRLADPGSWSSARCRSVGWGAGKKQVLTRCHRGFVLGGSPACWPTMGLDREVVTTLRGRCAGVGPPVVRRWRPRPVQRGAAAGGRGAAAACQARGP
jgi:hypothetical protein